MGAANNSGKKKEAQFSFLFFTFGNNALYSENRTRKILFIVGINQVLLDR